MGCLFPPDSQNHRTSSPVTHQTTNEKRDRHRNGTMSSRAGRSRSRPNSAPRPQGGRGGGRTGGRQSHRNKNGPRSLPASLNSTPKKNGELGAGSHTVNESDRIRLTKLLINLRDSSETKVEFPPDLTNTERKYIHELCRQLGLVSKSSGKGENRFITVTKRNEDKMRVAGISLAEGNEKEDEDDQYPILNIGRRGTSSLQQHIKKHPPTDIERCESYKTGSSLVSGSEKIGNNEDGLKLAMKEMGLLSVDDTSQNIHISRKKVDYAKRRQFHAKLQKRKKAHPNYNKMIEQRKRLPAFARRNEVCSTIVSNSVTVLSGETGCGKSTQVPQFLLDDPTIGPNASIVVTQPRRISAISVAERVSSEQCLDVGGLIGYQVRLESAVSQETQLLFLTPGVLLRKLQSSADLLEYNYIIIDEIHERDKYTEFLLITLRDLLPRRPDLKIILMSATLQTQALVEYWYSCGEKGGMPAEINIPGRTFPVQEFFLEDCLNMTHYLDKIGGGDVDKLEADLARLLSQQHQQHVTKKQTGRNQRNNNEQQGEIFDDRSSLVCVMCQKSGFSSAEELGSHVALCDGGGGVTMDALEERVRGINADEVVVHEVGRGPNAGDIEYEDYDDEKFEDGEEEFEDDDIPGLHHGKWDGESPFGVADVVTSKVSTLTDEELLIQYQSLHDDDQIDDMLVLEIIQLIVRSSYGDGAILIFLPGWQEISEFTLLLESSPPFQDRNKFLVLPLHSGIPSKDQRKVFNNPPSGVRKIILSTNIAETSLTIDDVAFVIDTGRAKEKSYDPHLKTSTLQPVWVSQASAKQRKGRAGRTKPGVCFHLFSSRRHSSFRPFTESELLRTPLEEMCLQCKKLNLAPGGPEDVDGVPAFLAKALTPPHPKSVFNALELLVDLGAMELETNALTSLGKCLSVLSLEPRVGKMVLYSHLLGCARSTACMGVAMSYKSPFILPPPSVRRSADMAKVELSKNSESDQVTVLYAIRKRDQLRQRQGAYHNFCRSNYLSPTTLSMIGDLRQNIHRELSSLGFENTTLPTGYHNRHDTDIALWQATIVAGLYPNVAFRMKGEANFSTMTNRKAKIHVSSVNAVRGQPLNSKSQVPEGEVEFVAFGEMVRGVTAFTMNQTTHLPSVAPLVLLCGNTLHVRPSHGKKKDRAILSLDDWLVFSCHKETASHLVILRKRLDSAFARITSNPSSGTSQLSGAERDAVDMVSSVIKSAHRAASER